MDDGKEYNLRLYVAGQTPKSLQAFANLKKICEEHLQGRYRIEVIDLVENPQLAKGTRFWPFPPWCGSFPSPCAKSSEIFQIPNASWWGST
jgi:circadian clock protein KaiB